MKSFDTEGGLLRAMLPNIVVERWISISLSIYDRLTRPHVESQAAREIQWSCHLPAFRLWERARQTLVRQQHHYLPMKYWTDLSCHSIRRDSKIKRGCFAGR